MAYYVCIDRYVYHHISMHIVQARSRYIQNTSTIHLETRGPLVLHPHFCIIMYLARRYHAALHTRRNTLIPYWTPHQVAVAKGLTSAAQHRRRRRPIILTLHNATTARDLRSPRESNPRRRTLHDKLARNNISALQGLNAQPDGTQVGAEPARDPHCRVAKRAWPSHSGR